MTGVVALTAPTGTKGYVDPFALGGQFTSLYLDLLEHIPDLTFPLSIPVYAKMRKDPKLAAIEAGWTLNLLRAQWQLDPAGCKPSVVQKVADGMGLAVKEKDKPGPARLRGVSWGDHLRAALRMIPFGFSPFELEADTSDGKTAKLAGVWERPPWTIANIHVDGKTGLLVGADQDGLTRKDQPQIPADRMAWYVRGREGANWAGTSLFRPCYASWLLKEEVRRHYGAANVRWSMGVPVMEALPGTSPTAAQMAEAMQMAAAARGGMQAGAASPPGFALKIMGISGSLPNSQEFLQYLDQQMSSSALLGVLDLGDTANGSRALGDVFIDVFHLALEAEGELAADIATRQIAARIVDWNFGPDENVPRVVVSGIGSRREVTAESLQLLLSSGALSADPALEEWVRREFRLPARAGMAEPKATAAGVDLKPETKKEPGRTLPDVAAGQGDQMSLFDVAAAGHNHFDPGEKRDSDGKWSRTGGPGKAGAAITGAGDVAGRPLRVRSALAKASTLGDIAQAAEAEVARIRGPQGRRIEFSFESDDEGLGPYRQMDPKTAREHVEGILRVLEAFPHAGLSRVRAAHTVEDDNLKGAYAYARKSEIVFNLGPGSTPGRRKYLSLLRAETASGWTVPNSASPIAVAIHEMGHILDIDTLGGYPAEHAHRLFADVGRPDRAVSRYAMTDQWELTAEAFTDVLVNGSASAPLSRKIFDGLVAEYREREAFESGKADG